MSTFGSTDAISKTIIVRCGVDTTFRTWTEQINAWWPKGHSRSGNPRTTVFLERRVGGWIYERTPEGVEHEWGEVTVWEPPGHFAYHWYLGSGSEQPTRVDVRHQGPEFIGALWSRTSAVFDAAWDALLPAYIAACMTDV